MKASLLNQLGNSSGRKLRNNTMNVAQNHKLRELRANCKVPPETALNPMTLFLDHFPLAVFKQSMHRLTIRQIFVLLIHLLDGLFQISTIAQSLFMDQSVSLRYQQCLY